MRIDIENNEHRGIRFRILLKLVSYYIGITPGPMLFMSYDLEQIPRDLINYMLRGSAKEGIFSKSERELISTFVSDLNSCHF